MVGNGDVPQYYSQKIDANDMVIRFNTCANYGNSGVRTDALVLVNFGESGRRLAWEDCIDPDALASAREFWIPNPPSILPEDRRRHPCEDYTADLIARRIGERPWKYLHADAYWEAQAALARLGASRCTRVSTGMQTLFHMRRFIPSSLVTLYGFSHEGWDGHPWEAERKQIDQWEDWVSRAINHTPPAPPPSRPSSA